VWLPTSQGDRFKQPLYAPGENEKSQAHERRHYFHLASPESGKPVMANRLLIPCLLLLATLAGHARGEEKKEQGKVTIRVLDRTPGKPVPCRIHLKDAAGKPQRAPDLPFWHDHFVCPGTVDLELPPGKYTFEVDRGPEYRVHRGSFVLQEKG